MIEENFQLVLSKFRLNSEPSSIKQWGEGHIHDTYLVESLDHQPDYILQKINHKIFHDIPGMMKNIEIVTHHIREKIKTLPGHDPVRESVNLIRTETGLAYCMDDEGNYWRMYVFIPETVTWQKMPHPFVSYEAGKAIGFFQSMLTDLATPLLTTIPDFHNINLRIQQFENAKQSDPESRIDKACIEIDFAQSRFECMKSYFEDLDRKAVIRATHNDTKLNNVLFDRENKALCLIDLDTVMPGYVHFDYGDALRTMANTALEDEKDLSKVHFNLDVYEQFTRGYLEVAVDFLTETEKELLPYAPIYLTFIIGLRFLTDYLNGDIYFRTHYSDHNLERAKVQFKLVSEMEKTLGF